MALIDRSVAYISSADSTTPSSIDRHHPEGNHSFDTLPSYPTSYPSDTDYPPTSLETSTSRLRQSTPPSSPPTPSVKQARAARFAESLPSFIPTTIPSFAFVMPPGWTRPSPRRGVGRPSGDQEDVRNAVPNGHASGCQITLGQGLNAQELPNGPERVERHLPPPQPQPHHVNGKPGRYSNLHSGVRAAPARSQRVNGAAAKPPGAWGPTWVQADYQWARSRQQLGGGSPLPASGSNAIAPFNSSAGRTLDVRNISYQSLQAFLQNSSTGAVVRVHHYRSKSHLVWDGDMDRSGFSAESFRALSPKEYAIAIEKSQLGPGWAFGPHFRDTAAKHVLGEVGEEPSPWISATANLDSAIWAIARALAHRPPEVRLAVIVPTTEVGIPAKDVLIDKPGGVVPDEQRGELLFFGRIFAQSIVADIRWTQKVRSYAVLNSLLTEAPPIRPAPKVLACIELPVGREPVDRPPALECQDGHVAECAGYHGQAD